MADDIIITEIVAATAVGLDMMTTCSSVRSGIARFTEMDWRNSDYEPYISAKIPDNCLPLDEFKDVNEVTEQGKRVIGLLLHILEQLNENQISEDIPFLLGLPKSLDPTISNIIQPIELVLKKKRPSNQYAFLPIAKGRASGVLAIVSACNLLRTEKVEIAIAGGCDSYIDKKIFKALEADRRLKTEINLDYFTPGEGVGLVCLATEKAALKYGLPVFGKIASASVGFEDGHLYSDIPYKGEGLAKTFQSLFDVYQGECIKTVFSGMNGEGIWGKELGVSYIRNRDRFIDDFQIEHPADCYGDIGAASGPVMTGLAVKGMRNEYIKGPVLVYASSDDGDRGAVIIDS